MPTYAQLEGLYRVSYYLTYLALQPIHLICIDERSKKGASRFLTKHTYPF
ncbi:DUF6888 family protein [Microcoleus sp. Pol10D4]